MPVLAVLIAPLLALYLKYKIMHYAVKLILFLAVYTSFKTGMQWAIDTVMSKMGNADFPCMTSYILNALDVFTMINFALSFYATVYMGRFFYNSMMKMI